MTKWDGSIDASPTLQAAPGTRPSGNKQLHGGSAHVLPDAHHQPLFVCNVSIGDTTMNTPSHGPGNASPYADCVASLRGSLSSLESSVATLGHGVSDFPRLAEVLKTVRHYELIPQPTLAAAEASLRDDIGPATALLLDRADAHMARVERRLEALKARAELQQGRLSSEQGKDSSKKEPTGKEKGKGGQLTGEAKLRARAVRQRKAALEYSVQRLELEVLQKERELRKQIDNA